MASTTTANETVDRAALISAGRYRLSSILVTSLIASLALMPLALGSGTGSTMPTPLVITIISGLLVVAPLELIVTPIIYSMLAAPSDVASSEPSAGQTTRPASQCIVGFGESLGSVSPRCRGMTPKLVNTGDLIAVAFSGSSECGQYGARRFP